MVAVLVLRSVLRASVTGHVRSGLFSFGKLRSRRVNFCAQPRLAVSCDAKPQPLVSLTDSLWKCMFLRLPESDVAVQAKKASACGRDCSLLRLTRHAKCTRLGGYKRIPLPELNALSCVSRFLWWCKLFSETVFLACPTVLPIMAQSFVL